MKIDYYFNNSDERESIIENGYQEVISKYTYDHRIEEIFKN